MLTENYNSGIIFVNGNKCRLVSLSNGLSILGCFGSWWKEYDTETWPELVSLRESGDLKSTWGIQGAIKLPSADAAGIQSVLPGAIIDWPGSPEHTARVKSAAGTRGGASSSAPAPAAPAPAPAPAAADSGAVPPSVDALGVLRSALSASAGPLGATLAAGVAPAVNAWAAAEIAARVADAVKSTKINTRVENKPDQTFTITLPDGTTKTLPGVAHKKLETVIKLLWAGRNVYLYGPAGSGKSTLCKQAAAALGLDFYADNRVIDPYALSGFVAPDHKATETQCKSAAINGGVYLADEFDAWDPSAAVWLNSLTANRFASFPGVGMVQAHKDFKFICAGNTIGRGADSEYTGRCVMDASVLSRVCMVTCDYDRNISLYLAGACGAELVDFVDDVRRACASCGVSLVSGTREIENIAASAAAGLDDVECLECGLIKGLETDQIKLIVSALSVRGRWFDALRELAAAA